MATWWTGLAEAPPHDAQALHALGLGFMAARTLHVALELRVFTHLAAGALTPAQLGAVLGLAERATARLLSACAALGLLRRTPEGFCNTPLTQRYLVEGQRTFIGAYLQLFDTLGYARWAQLGSALRQNAPVDDVQHPYQHLATEAHEAATFSAAQHAGSQSLGYALARRIDLTPFHCLLDLGGGSGAYTVAMLQRYPHLTAILMDFPPVCRLAEAVMQQEGLASRVRFVAGDYERDPLPAGADVVLWSGNLHASSPDTCRHVLTKLHAVLPAGGLLLLHDYLLDDSRTSPCIPALLELHLMLVSAEGQIYSQGELQELLTHAGFRALQSQPFLPGHSSLVQARVHKEPAEHTAP